MVYGRIKNLKLCTKLAETQYHQVYESLRRNLIRYLKKIIKKNAQKEKKINRLQPQ
jgi:hypothetical protein